MRNSRLIGFATLGGIVVLVLLLILVLILSNFGNTKEDRKFNTIALNLQNAKLNDDSISFFSGSFFANYSLKNNTIRRLSDYLFIQSGITNVSWAENGVLFQTNPSNTDRDDITTAATSLGVSPDQPHWWRYDFSNKQYQLLHLKDVDTCTIVVQIDQHQFACATPETDGSHATTLTLLNSSLGTSKTIVSSEDSIDNIQYTDNHVFYVITHLGGNQTLWSADSSSLKTQKLYDSQGTFSYRAVGAAVAIDDASSLPGLNQSEDEGATGVDLKTDHTLVFIADGQVITKKKLKSYPLSFYGGRNGVFHYSSLDGSINTLSRDGITPTAPEASTVLEVGDALFKYGDHFFVLKSDTSLASSPGIKHEAGYRAPSRLAFKDNADDGSSTILKAEGSIHDTYLFDSTIPSSIQQQKVGDLLATKGFRPSEIEFNWIIDGTDFHAPVQPNVTAVE